MSRRSSSCYHTNRQAAWTRALIIGDRSSAVLPEVSAHECRAEVREGTDREGRKVKIIWRH
ncbi:MAG: hypothetical protein IIZ06_07430 [Kiritimatiellae bacterium]|nr:hypothetical protein [Kiritimatiellia bacterium]